ncbi:unnamed protein product, partial [Polarella glacialis]
SGVAQDVVSSTPVEVPLTMSMPVPATPKQSSSSASASGRTDSAPSLDGKPAVTLCPAPRALEAADRRRTPSPRPRRQSARLRGSASLQGPPVKERQTGESDVSASELQHLADAGAKRKWLWEGSCK